jgi:hypothetical protein
MLSYRPDIAEHDLGGASDGLTGSFRDVYTNLIRVTPDRHGDRWLISGFDRSEARTAEFASPHAFERYCL